MCFTFRSVTHFELIFVNGVRSMSRFIFLRRDVQLVVSTSIVEKTTFLGLHWWSSG